MRKAANKGKKRKMGRSGDKIKMGREMVKKNGEGTPTIAVSSRFFDGTRKENDKTMQITGKELCRVSTVSVTSPSCSVGSRC